MFVLYAFLVSLVCEIFFFPLLKLYQLEGYSIKNYFKKVLKFDFRLKGKNQLAITKRAKRLFIFDFFLKFSLFLIIFGLNTLFWLNFALVAIVVVFNFVFVAFTFLLEKPIEKLIKAFYIKKAKKKLKSCGCKKIAITGSFGKTSTKNFLYNILKQEFDVCATPKSFNTPMGICKTILEDLKETDDFFIVEMGARRIGDIEFLSKFVGVDFGIITPIGLCHLETFGSLSNIEHEKFQLCKYSKELVVFNGKSISTKNLWKQYEQNKFLVCEENSFAYAEQIKTCNNGTTFVLVLDGKKIKCKTSLLGKSNIDNVVVASAMAYLLGESLFGIKKGIESLKAVPHRLELIKGEVVNVIDDSYNSNKEGFLQALEVLSGFDGRKIVVSPGIVELGKEQYSTNLYVASQVAKVADIFVIMNETNKKALYEGVCKAGMDGEKIYFANSRAEQTKLLKQLVGKGDVVLFENDLPDNFK